MTETKKRLTTRGYHYDAIPLSLAYIRRLQEFEDMLEDGLLEQLPCKEGTIVYELAFDKEDPCAWCKYDHSGFGETSCELEYDEYPTVHEYLCGQTICPQFEIQVWAVGFDLAFWVRHKKDFKRLS